MSDRPDVPATMIRRLQDVFDGLPECPRTSAWVGVAWKVRQATVAHVFGGEDGLFRITFRTESSEVMAFEKLGDPYFRAGWGGNVVGMLLDEETDWEELSELLTDSYCLQAPAGLAETVRQPGS
ncbi:MmcQ/YjbR family DNA-binding protein [Phytomonospora sp. NPDC050363]|uniref:MmcQ/YjbR family DNA-binding protein n=1 Tax=Phytomonospora sp. NPDC050363 TaxID=3155642 RepID=UPI0033DD74F0